MRQNLVFFVLLGLLGVLVISVATRDRKPHVVRVSSASAAPSVAAASASGAPASSGSAAPAPAPAGLGRVLRVSGAAWEVLSPIILANDGLEPKKDSDTDKAGLRVVVSVVRDTEAIEAGLARGGTDEAGADLAVLPLPSLIASYQKLSALRPVVVMVSAWSRGREVVRGKQPLDKLPSAGEIALATETDPSVAYFALFALELAGVAPSRVRLAERGDAKVQLTATVRSELKPAEQKDVLLSTAEATRFAPYVLVCSAALVEKHPEVVSVFLKSWLAGAKRLASDPTASARTLSQLKDAPEPLALLGRLGEVSQVGLGENAELLGLSGRGAVTVDSLLARMWRLSREARLVNVPAPERTPVASGLVAQLVRADPAQAKVEVPATSSAKPKAGARPLVVVRLPPPLDSDGVQAEIGFVSGVFQRSPIRLSAEDKKQRERFAKDSTERFGIPAGRLGAGTTAARGGEFVIEVLPVP